MTAPRRTVGTSPAGRLPAAMLRALAAELSDPGRFSRAKAYARDGAVIDIVVEPGQARGLVQGSRYEPYAVTIHTEPAGDGEGLLGLIPERDEVLTECTCPDAETFGTCKHGLAVLLVLADEVSIDATTLERWRSADGHPRHARGDVGVLPPIDVLAVALAAPAPRPDLPTVPSRLPIAMAATPGTRDADVAAAVASAIAALRS